MAPANGLRGPALIRAASAAAAALRVLRALPRSPRLRALLDALKHAALDDNGALAPVRHLLTSGQLHAMLLAYLPVRYGTSFQTGNFAVDMFITTALATLAVALLSLAGQLASALLGTQQEASDLVTVRVDYLQLDQYSEKVPNSHWQALAWLVSRSSRSQAEGAFRMVVTNDEVPADELRRMQAVLGDLPGEADEFGGKELDAKAQEVDALDSFNVLPRDSSRIRFSSDGFLFEVWFDTAETGEDTGDKKKSEFNTSLTPTEPALVVSRVADASDNPCPPATVEWMQAWLLRISRRHRAWLNMSKRRGRWEIRSDGGYWMRTHTLHSSRGLRSVALDRAQEDVLLRDLERFAGDREFYAKIGMPYRRGYLFSGPPGTGKTSLVQAISATYGRDLYYLNLKEIKDDAMLQSAFSNVPKNSIIVLEDVDAQSTIVHARTAGSPSPTPPPLPRPASPTDADGGDSDSSSDSEDEEPAFRRKRKSGPSNKKGLGLSDFFGPTLSALLNCLDGYSTNEGLVVIMTSNHPELLDPALVRPGRIDLHLELGYATHYQLQRMYATVLGLDSASDPADRPCTPLSDASGDTEIGSSAPPALDLTGIPERVLPPCDAMRLMVLHRGAPWEIAGRLRRRCAELAGGKGVGDAMECYVVGEDGEEGDGW